MGRGKQGRSPIIQTGITESHARYAAEVNRFKEEKEEYDEKF
ncbi:MAG: hypothetical protein ACUVWO_05530 [Thermodesulfobacteriota bacterium]